VKKYFYLIDYIKKLWNILQSKPTKKQKLILLYEKIHLQHLFFYFIEALLAELTLLRLKLYRRLKSPIEAIVGLTSCLKLPLETNFLCMIFAVFSKS